MNDIFGVETLSEVLAIEDEGRGAELGIHVVAKIDFKYAKIFVVKVVGALAVESSVHGLGKIEMGNCFKTNLGEINIMLAAVIVDFHERNETEAWQPEGESEVKHTFHFAG